MPETKKEIMQVLMERAEKGAATMDKRLPGWYQKIDRDRLNLENYYNCILGQCFKGYYPGMQALELNGDEETQLGFYLENAEKRHYPLLTACWTKLINERLANNEQETQTAALSTPPQNACQQNHLTANAV